MTLLRNSITTPDGTNLISKFKHDYQDYRDKEGNYYAVDGGLDYLKRVGKIELCEETSLYDTDSIEVLREELTWGTYGKDGTEDLQYIKIKDMSIDHIQAVLNTIKTPYKLTFEKELEFRTNTTTQIYHSNI